MLAHRIPGEFGKCFTSCKRNGISGQININVQTRFRNNDIISAKRKALHDGTLHWALHYNINPWLWQLQFRLLNGNQKIVVTGIPIAWYHTLLLCTNTNIRIFEYSNIPYFIFSSIIAMQCNAMKWNAWIEFKWIRKNNTQYTYTNIEIKR